MKTITTTFILLLSLSIANAQEINYNEVKSQVNTCINNNVLSINNFQKNKKFKELNITNFRILDVSALEEDSIINLIGEPEYNYLVHAIVDLNDKSFLDKGLSVIVEFELEKIFNSYQINFIQLTGLKFDNDYQCLEGHNVFILEKVENFCFLM